MDNSGTDSAKAYLHALEDSLRAVGRSNRRFVQIEGFDIFIDEASAAYFLSYAVPTMSTHWHRSIQTLVETFSQYQRQTRLEYFHELHPELKVELEKAGFVQAMRAPVMALVKDKLVRYDDLKQGRYYQLTYKDEAELEKALRYQSLAYGGNGDDGALVWFDSMIKGLKTGSLMVGLLEYSGDLVSGASVQIGGAIGELAGVWTHPDKQNRGFAFELCHHLLEDYFRRHNLCWLSAAEGAQRLYKKLGFEVIGTQFNYEIHFSEH